MRQVLFTIPIFGGIKVFGYGAMLVLAFIGSTWLATWRARREKLDPEVILDMAFWIFFIGLAGAPPVLLHPVLGQGHRQPARRRPVLEGGDRLLRRHPGRGAGLLRLSPPAALPPPPLPRRDGPADHGRHAVRPARLLPQRLLLRRCLQPAVGGLVPQALAPLGPPVHARPDPSRRRPIRSPSTRRRSIRPSTRWSS